MEEAAEAERKRLEEGNACLTAFSAQNGIFPSVKSHAQLTRKRQEYFASKIVKATANGSDLRARVSNELGHIFND